MSVRRVSQPGVTSILGADAFILYSINWEIRGLDLENTGKPVLAPISKIAMATSIDFYAIESYIYWVDGDRGSITRIKRDGTEREVVIEGLESVEGLAVDWISGTSL